MTPALRSADVIPRGRLLTGLLGALLLAGCTAVTETTHVGEPDRVPLVIEFPTIGASAHYASSLGEEDIRVGGIIPVSGPGFEGSAVWLRHELVRDIGHSTADDFVAAHGSRVFNAAPCAALGLGFSQNGPPCPPRTRLSGTYLAQGLPALHGAAYWWGESIDIGSLHLNVTLLGIRYHLPANVSATDSCRVVQIDTSLLPPLTDQRFGFLPELASEIGFCDASPFPAWYRIEGVEYRRAATVAGTEVIVGDALAGFWGRAAPGAQSVRFPGRGITTTGDWDLESALEWALDNTDEGRRLAHEDWILHFAGDMDGASASIAGTRVASDGGFLIELETRDRVWAIEVRRSCDPLGCEHSIGRESSHATIAVPNREALPRTIPPADAVRTAEKTMDDQVIGSYVGTVIRAHSGVDLAVDGYHYTFLGPPDGSFGVPQIVRIQGSDGTIYAVDTSWDRAAQVLGLPTTWPES